MRLSDKVAIITGAGAGIGEATAIRFAEEGAHLVLADLNEANATAVVEKVQAAGGEAIAVRADISKEEDARRISDAAVARFGRIDILVNNAADFTQRAVEDATLADWHRVFGVNVAGTAMVSKYAIPHMQAAGGGAIVNISSKSGIIAQPKFATYNSSKGAIIILTRCMALDLAPFNIRVNTVCPGTIYTTATEREWTRFGETREQWTAREAPPIMLKRIGEAREVANAILFLASDEASFITATDLLVDGGYVAQ